jgi:hypothetical protein
MTFVKISMVRHYDTPLSVLENVTTNQSIPNSPVTIDGIEKLPLDDFNATMQKLGAYGGGEHETVVAHLRATV